MTPLLQAFLTKGRIIHALFIQILLSEHGKSKIGYVTALLKPLGQVIMLSTMFTIIGRNAAIGDSLVLFLTIGIITYNLSVTPANKMLRINKAPQKVIQSTPSTAFDFSVAFLLSESIILIIAAVVLLLGLGNFGYWDHQVDSLLGILLTTINAVLLGYGIGLFNLSIATITPAYEKVWKIVSMPLFIMSGVVFVVDQRFPPEIVTILSYNPLLHIIEAMRSSFYRTWDSAIYDLNYVMWFSVTALFLGALLQKLTQNKERK